MKRDNESKSHYAARMEQIDEEFNSEQEKKDENVKSKAPATDDDDWGKFSFPSGVRLITDDEWRWD